MQIPFKTKDKIVMIGTLIAGHVDSCADAQLTYNVANKAGEVLGLLDFGDTAIGYIDLRGNKSSRKTVRDLLYTDYHTNLGGYPQLLAISRYKPSQHTLNGIDIYIRMSLYAVHCDWAKPKLIGTFDEPLNNACIIKWGVPIEPYTAGQTILYGEDITPFKPFVSID